MPGKSVQRKDKKKMLRVRHFRKKMDRSKSYLDRSRNEGERGIRITYLYRINTCTSHTIPQGLTKYMQMLMIFIKILISNEQLFLQLRQQRNKDLKENPLSQNTNNQENITLTFSSKTLSRTIWEKKNFLFTEF